MKRSSLRFGTRTLLIAITVICIGFYIATISLRRQPLPGTCGERAGAVRNGEAIDIWTLSDGANRWRPVAKVLNKRKASERSTHPMRRSDRVWIRWEERRGGWRIDIDGKELRFAPAYVTAVCLELDGSYRVLRVPIKHFTHSSGNYLSFKSNEETWQVVQAHGIP